MRSRRLSKEIFPCATQRLILRPFERADAVTLLPAFNEIAAYCNSDGARFTGAKMLERRIGYADRFSDWYLGMFNRESGAFVGEIDLWLTNYKTGMYEVGYYVMQNARRQGFVSEALENVLYLAQDQQAINCIRAYHVLETNAASLASLAKCGFASVRVRKPAAGHLFFEKDMRPDAAEFSPHSVAGGAELRPVFA